MNSVFVTPKQCRGIFPVFMRYIDHAELVLHGWYKCNACGVETKGEDLVFDSAAPGSPQLMCGNIECLKPFSALTLKSSDGKAEEHREKQRDEAQKTSNCFYPFPNISFVRDDFSIFGGPGWEAVRCMIRNAVMREGQPKKPPIALYPGDDDSHIEMVSYLIAHGEHVPDLMEIGVKQSQVKQGLTGNVMKLKKMVSELEHMGYAKTGQSINDRNVYWGIADENL